MANLGYVISDKTVGNVLRRNGLPPTPERKRMTPWSVFIRTHLALLAGTDFLTAEVLTLRSLVTYYVHYVLFFIHLESRRVDIAGNHGTAALSSVSLLRERPLVGPVPRKIPVSRTRIAIAGMAMQEAPDHIKAVPEWNVPSDPSLRSVIKREGRARAVPTVQVADPAAVRRQINVANRGHQLLYCMIGLGKLAP